MLLPELTEYHLVLLERVSAERTARALRIPDPEFLDLNELLEQIRDRDGEVHDLVIRFHAAYRQYFKSTQEMAGGSKEAREGRDKARDALIDRCQKLESSK